MTRLLAWDYTRTADAVGSPRKGLAENREGANNDIGR
jgi:hypothetical protein